ncbi:MAG: hypothetical protein EBR82_18960 [Caulobacteraceae bacterium]|nr:hypothetical protein [Caulobacteraceae bacterium]
MTGTEINLKLNEILHRGLGLCHPTETQLRKIGSELRAIARAGNELDRDAVDRVRKMIVFRKGSRAAQYL